METVVRFVPKPWHALFCSLSSGVFGLAGLWYAHYSNSTSSIMLEIVCASVGFPTSLLFILYYCVITNKGVHTRTLIKSSRKKDAGMALDENPGISREKHLAMMLSDPLLRNPLMYLQCSRCNCADFQVRPNDPVPPYTETDMLIATTSGTQFQDFQDTTNCLP